MRSLAAGPWQPPAAIQGAASQGCHAAVARESQKIWVLGGKLIAQGLQVKSRRLYVFPSPSSDSKLVCFQFRQQLETLTRILVTSDISVQVTKVSVARKKDYLKSPGMKSSSFPTWIECDFLFVFETYFIDKTNAILLFPCSLKPIRLWGKLFQFMHHQNKLKFIFSLDHKSNCIFVMPVNSYIH